MLELDESRAVVVVVSDGVVDIAYCSEAVHAIKIDYDLIREEEKDISDALGRDDTNAAHALVDEHKKLREIAFALELVNEVIKLDQVINRSEKAIASYYLSL